MNFTDKLSLIESMLDKAKKLKGKLYSLNNDISDMHPDEINYTSLVYETYFDGIFKEEIELINLSKRFEFYHLESYNDSTALYDVEINKPSILNQLISYIIKIRENEYGTITVGDIKMKYSYGELETDINEIGISKLLSEEIWGVKARGNYGLMDYVVELR